MRRPSLNPVHQLSRRRQALGMSFPVLAQRSGLSLVTVKRILSGASPETSFASIAAIAQALGVSIGLEEQDAQEMREAQARAKAELIVRYVQGSSALEGQAVDAQTYAQLVDQSFHEFLAGPNRHLWAE